MQLFTVIEKQLKECREVKKLSKKDEAELLVEVIKSIRTLRRPKPFAKPKTVKNML